ncbi:MAG TPA: flagellar cap protein FliD N-terminal domain-containing protein, partial [Pirellulales bacterium]|nr:flagellar cap protein FliD N-terminal domain-containing protein [Pirellulales bacterium]
MASISAGIGLVTGLNITQTVSQLVSIQAAPRDALTAQNTTLASQKSALTQLEALVLGVQFAGDALKQSSLFAQRTATSTNTAALTATVTGNPAVGNYQYTPLQLAQNDQFQSSAFANQTNPIGAGSFTLRFGGTVNQGVALDVLNGGNGVPRGSLQITDHSGATAQIDLSSATNIDDVLGAINSNSTIHVTATTVNGHIQLTDNSIGSQNLTVQDIGAGTTAAALGLAGINTSSATASGSNLVSLFDDLGLSQINNGNGVRFDNALSDLQINFQDGTSSTVDFHQLSTPGTKAQGTTTAANGTSSQLTFTAVKAGSDSAGVSVKFVNDGTVTEGQETAAYDATNKTLTFNISSGQTTAEDIVSALQRDPTASAAFTATTVAGSGGNGIVNVNDTAYIIGPPSTATTPATLGLNSQLVFTAVNGGPAFDNTEISFVDNPSITAGHETVAYDNSDPNHPKLTFQIAAGSTTAQNIIHALNQDPAAGQIFEAATSSGSDGSGLISVDDTATTSGGAIVEPINPVQE